MHRRNLVALADSGRCLRRAQPSARPRKSRSPSSPARPARWRPTPSRPSSASMMGLDYATGGTMMVAGKKLVVIEKDDQGKPDVGKSLLAAAYADDKVDIAVGPTGSGVALAMLPVAEEYKKILLVEPAVADSITGDKWNKYIFRTGRNSSQDATSNAVALDKPGDVIATLAQDNAFGRDGVKAFKDAHQARPRSSTRNTCPSAPPISRPALQRIIDKLKDQPGRKIISVELGRRAGKPFQDRRPGPQEALRHRDRHRRQHPAGDGGLQAVPGHGRRAVLLLRHPQEPGQRGAWWRSITSSSRRRRISSPPADSRPPWRW